MKIITAYSPWFIILCLALAFLLTFLLYYRDRQIREFKSWLVALLASFRFLIIAILSFLLLSPLLKNWVREVADPIVLVAVDNSASMLAQDSNFYEAQIKAPLAQIETELGDDFELIYYTFGEAVEKQSQVDFSERSTNMAALLRSIDDRYANRNVGAMILLSDGIYNQGANPEYLAKQSPFPIYPLALGDTSIKKDVILQRINQNKIAYLGNNFPVEIEIQAFESAAETTSLKIFKGDQLLFQEEIAIEGERYTTTVKTNLEAQEIGLQRYSVVLSSLEAEVNLTNNRKDFYIDVLDGRQKILLVAAYPHPDINAVRQAIEKNKNYEVTVSTLADLDANLDAYNMVVLHQIPSNDGRSLSLLKALETKRLASLFILGGQTNTDAFNRLDLGLNISNTRLSNNDAQAEPVNNFSLFSLTEEELKLISKFPPLETTFGDYKTSVQNQVLFQQRIGQVKTEQPLWLFLQDEARKVGVISGGGLWRWRLDNYVREGNHEVFDALIRKSVQYLALKADKSFFRLTTKNEFLENEDVIFDAELYNDSYELINTAEVEVEISDQEGNKYPFSFSNNGDRYFLNAGELPVGAYRFRATTVVNGNEMEEIGEFSVQEIRLESAVTVADHQLLLNMAEVSGGELLYVKDLERFPAIIQSRNDIKAISYSEEEIRELIHWKWLFFMLLAFLSLEWFLRKRNGAY